MEAFEYFLASMEDGNFEETVRKLGRWFIG